MCEDVIRLTNWSSISRCQYWYMKFCIAIQYNVCASVIWQRQLKTWCCKIECILAIFSHRLHVTHSSQESRRVEVVVREHLAGIKHGAPSQTSWCCRLVRVVAYMCMKLWLLLVEISISFKLVVKYSFAKVHWALCRMMSGSLIGVPNDNVMTTIEQMVLLSAVVMWAAFAIADSRSLGVEDAFLSC